MKFVIVIFILAALAYGDLIGKLHKLLYMCLSMYVLFCIATDTIKCTKYHSSYVGGTLVEEVQVSINVSFSTSAPYSFWVIIPHTLILHFQNSFQWLFQMIQRSPKNPPTQA